MTDNFDTHDGHTQSSKDAHHEPKHNKEHKAVPIESPACAQPAQKPSIGRIVHYVLDSGQSKGQHRPAIIVRVWDANPTVDSLAQLQVFTDGSNDGGAYKNGIYWATSVHYADPSENKPGTYHWPERV